MKKLALHWKILLGMLVGVLFALLLTNFDWGASFIGDWIKPFGTIFISSLKLIAIPLILAALIKGISDLKDISSLSKMGAIAITGYVSSVGDLTLEKPYQELDFNTVDSNVVRCPDAEMASKMIAKIKEIKKQGDTIGGIITCVIQNVPVGLGEPVFDKLHAQLGKAMLSINAVKGFEFGSGFKGATMNGSEHNDLFNQDGTTKSNLSGGVQGGISNGMDIYFRVAFKPVATIMQKQQTINSKGEKVEMQGKGRHDPCVVPRAVPIVEAMAALTIADFWLANKLSKL